jgi:hypothetical protein
MDRDELTALRDAIDVMLAWPDALRAEIARWLSPEAAKPGTGLILSRRRSCSRQKFRNGTSVRRSDRRRPMQARRGLARRRPQQRPPSSGF